MGGPFLSLMHLSFSLLLSFVIISSKIQQNPRPQVTAHPVCAPSNTLASQDEPFSSLVSVMLVSFQLFLLLI